MPKVEELKITGEKGKILFRWKHSVCIKGKNPLVLSENGEVQELMGASPIELDGPTVVLRSTERCRGPEAKPLLNIKPKKRRA